MQILIGTHYTIISIDQSRMNTGHLFTFIKSQFATHKIDKNKIFLTYSKENHFKHLFLMKWIYTIHKNVTHCEIANLRDVLIGRIEKPIHIITKKEIEAVNMIFLYVIEGRRIRFIFEEKNYQLFWELQCKVKNYIYKISYPNNFFEMVIETENSKDQLRCLLEMDRILEMRVQFNYNESELSDLLQEKENDDRVEDAFRFLDSKPDEHIAIIKKRYKKLLVKFHPDNVYQEGSKKIDEYTEIFKNLQLSFEIIQKQNSQF